MNLMDKLYDQKKQSDTGSRNRTSHQNYRHSNIDQGDVTLKIASGEMIPEVNIDILDSPNSVLIKEEQSLSFN